MQFTETGRILSDVCTHPNKALTEITSATTTMAGGGERVSSAQRRWEDLNLDVLVTIFSKTGVADLIAGVPFVCSPWRDAARDPHCWKNLDFSDWGSIARRLGCRRQDPIDFVDLLDFSITRSHDFVDSVIFPDFADEIDLLYVADR